MMKKAWTHFSVLLLGCFVELCFSRGIRIGRCDDITIYCNCGESDFKVSVTTEQCTAAYRWEIVCRPCIDEPQDLCKIYKGCLQCHANGGDVCIACPPGKYGRWCQHDCRCVNGGVCEKDGKCTCPIGFDGSSCEINIGCDPPEPVAEPLEVVFIPPEKPVTVVYSCPQEYELRGSSVITCLEDKKWSSLPPVCLPKCPPLSVPANAHLTYSKRVLIEGVNATVSCDPHHQLIGEGMLTCSASGTWDGQLPVCEKLSSCPDPGQLENARRHEHSDSVQLGNTFIEGSQIYYHCEEGYEQLGNDTLVCLQDGTWSDELPLCIRVSTVILDCNTRGSEIVSSKGVPVRIYCPPECICAKFNVWGTSIYRQDSSLCQAAIHASKVTNSGGLGVVINNGKYSDFTGSSSNHVESKAFQRQDDSFRFDKLPLLNLLEDSKDCEKRLVKLHQECVYVSNNRRSYEEARAICTNMGLELQIPLASEDRERLWILLGSKGVNIIWTREDSKISWRSHVINETEARMENETCLAMAIDNEEFSTRAESCNNSLNYVCLRKALSFAAVCEDPGTVSNGTSEPFGRIDGTYFVGSCIKFSCHQLHYLKGVDTIFCTGNGSWSDSKPICVKVKACEEPVAPFAGFITYMPPLRRHTKARKGSIRTAKGRSSRIRTGLSTVFQRRLPKKKRTEHKKVNMPAGFHKVGARAAYMCESKYYELIGSRTRRCQENGEWSGRPPTCIPVCGKSDSPRTPFLINGNATDKGQWPWQSAISRYFPQYDQWFIMCSGSLLNERWVITAAHCVTYEDTVHVIETEAFKVYVGKYHRQDSYDDEYVKVRKVREIHVHSEYDPALFDSDIALIELESPVELSNRVKPICLPTDRTARDNLIEGRRGVVTGWGMNENESYSETLQQAVLPVVSHDICEMGYEEANITLTVTDNMYCAGFPAGGADTCRGDSGGPMVFLDEYSKEKKWVLEGVVSWGSENGCGQHKQYSGFTTVSKFLDWIHLFI